MNATNKGDYPFPDKVNFKTTTLPKIPIATYKNHSVHMNNNNPSLNKPKFANQMFPSILQKENKVKVCYLFNRHIINLFDFTSLRILLLVKSVAFSFIPGCLCECVHFC